MSHSYAVRQNQCAHIKDCTLESLDNTDESVID
jgi:hypothetical protein